MLNRDWLIVCILYVSLLTIDCIYESTIEINILKTNKKRLFDICIRENQTGLNSALGALSAC